MIMFLTLLLLFLFGFAIGALTAMLLTDPRMTNSDDYADASFWKKD
jgi:hypothetical protein